MTKIIIILFKFVVRDHESYLYVDIGLMQDCGILDIIDGLS